MNKSLENTQRNQTFLFALLHQEVLNFYATQNEKYYNHASSVKDAIMSVVQPKQGGFGEEGVLIFRVGNYVIRSKPVCSEEKIREEEFSLFGNKITNWPKNRKDVYLRNPQRGTYHYPFQENGSF